MTNVAVLHSGALPRFAQFYLVVFLLEVTVVFLPHRVFQVKLLHFIGVNVGVEVGHDGEDDADAQQQAGKQQELYPLR